MQVNAICHTAPDIYVAALNQIPGRLDTSSLFELCQVPEEAVSKERFFKAVEIYPEEESERFFLQISAARLKFFRKRFLEPLLNILISKANLPDSTLSKKSCFMLMRLPPFLLLIAIESGMDLVALSRYFSFRQLRYLARFAKDDYLHLCLNFLIYNRCETKFFALLKNVRSKTVYDTFVYRLNHELFLLKRAFIDEVKEIEQIQKAAEERKIKACVHPSISSRHFLTDNERSALNKSTNELAKSIKIVNSLFFQGLIASLKNAEDLSDNTLLDLYRLAEESEALV